MRSVRNVNAHQPVNLFGGIEAGGTKFVLMVATDPEHIFARSSIPAREPAVTIPEMIRFFTQAQEHLGSLCAIGVASFGPVDLNPRSPHYGCITTTPKVAWSNFNWFEQFQKALGLPLKVDTDVNCAALGERKWGNAQGLDNFIYLTVGTGIGGGAMVGGTVYHGQSHLEMGHMRVPHDRQQDPFPGVCPYHGDCLEGLASGPALEHRWGTKPADLPPKHPAWELEADYLALALVNLIYTLSPQRILLGGGVMKQVHLFDLLRDRIMRLLGGYHLPSSMDSFLLPPGLGDESGVLGAIALAQQTHAYAEQGGDDENPPLFQK